MRISIQEAPPICGIIADPDLKHCSLTQDKKKYDTLSPLTVHEPQKKNKG